MSESSVVYVKLPKAGLANMLLTWSRGFVFAHLNNLEMHTSSWTKIHIRKWLRRERKKRLYLGYFKRGGLLKSIQFHYFCFLKRKVVEPAVEQTSILPNSIFVFNKIFSDYDFFKEVRPYRDIVKKGIFDMLNPALQQQYDSFKKPVIGIHIRRGDFIRGSTITPLSFFVDVINGIRQKANSDLPVTVFTDAMPGEIMDLGKLKNIMIAKPKPDILDLLLLASSEILVLSIGSTFSYWAAFLSDGIIIKNKGEWHVPFRKKDNDESINEIIWDDVHDVDNLPEKLSLCKNNL